MKPIKTSTKVKYPIGYYAPGDYWCKCSTCGEKFTGDKRAVQCEPCGINKTKESLHAIETGAMAAIFNLKEFCDESLMANEMIADASRKASTEIQSLRDKAQHYQSEITALKSHLENREAEIKALVEMSAETIKTNVLRHHQKQEIGDWLISRGVGKAAIEKCCIAFADYISNNGWVRQDNDNWVRDLGHTVSYMNTTDLYTLYLNSKQKNKSS